MVRLGGEAARGPEVTTVVEIEEHAGHDSFVWAKHIQTESELQSV